MLEFSDRLEDGHRQEFRLYCVWILAELCYKNKGVCWGVVRGTAVMGGVQGVLEELRGLFRMGVRFREGEDLGLYVGTLRLVQYLGYYD